MYLLFTHVYILWEESCLMNKMGCSIPVSRFIFTPQLTAFWFITLPNALKRFHEYLSRRLCLNTNNWKIKELYWSTKCTRYALSVYREGIYEFMAAFLSRCIYNMEKCKKFSHDFKMNLSARWMLLFNHVFN